MRSAYRLADILARHDAIENLDCLIDVIPFLEVQAESDNVCAELLAAYGLALLRAPSSSDHVKALRTAHDAVAAAAAGRSRFPVARFQAMLATGDELGCLEYTESGLCFRLTNSGAAGFSDSPRSFFHDIS